MLVGSKASCRSQWAPYAAKLFHEFGYFYTHFFYMLQDRPPYHMTATTGEFCIGAAQKMPTTAEIA